MDKTSWLTQMKDAVHIAKEAEASLTMEFAEDVVPVLYGELVNAVKLTDSLGRQPDEWFEVKEVGLPEKEGWYAAIRHKLYSKSCGMYYYDPKACDDRWENVVAWYPLPCPLPGQKNESE